MIDGNAVQTSHWKGLTFMCSCPKDCTLVFSKSDSSKKCFTFLAKSSHLSEKTP
jgi:hypothetical protein